MKCHDTSQAKSVSNGKEFNFTNPYLPKDLAESRSSFVSAVLCTVNPPSNPSSIPPHPEKREARLIGELGFGIGDHKDKRLPHWLEEIGTFFLRDIVSRD